MEGLEISEISKSHLENEFTLGAEFYSPLYLNPLSVLCNSQLLLKPLSTCCTLITDGDHGSADYVEKGITFVLSESVKNGWIDKYSCRQISEKYAKKLNRSKLKTGDVLITKTGVNFGRSAVVTEEFSGSNTIAHVGLLRLKKEINPYYLSTFFNSLYGYSQLRKRGIKATRPEIKLIEFKDILVAVPSISFQLKIEEIVMNAQEKLLSSINFYQQSESFLLNAIYSKKASISEEQINIKPFKESFLKTGRLDAEYYQSKYESYYHVITNYLGGFSFIKDEFEHIIYTSSKKEKGYYYIEIGDVNVSDGSCQANYIETELLPTNAKVIARKGDILISNVRPNRGAISIIEIDYKNLIVSGAFTVLRTKDNSPYSNELLKVLLRLPIYRDWLLQFNVGTQYPVIKDEDILNLPIPLFSKHIQNEVTINIRQAGKLKKQSEQLLEIAKTAVEIAIEQNEEIAIDYINSHNELMLQDGNLH